MRFKGIIFFLIIIVVFNQASEDNLKKVVIQLRWIHQFQFAGYYMAKEKGYFNDIGVEVELREGKSGTSPIEEVLSGRADFGIGSSGLLLSYLKGNPLKVLAVIFQNSPSVLITKKSSNITTVSDLCGKRVMMMEGNADAIFQMMFIKEGISLKSINIQPSSFNIDDLINEKTDAFNSYTTNEPFYLAKKGVEFNIINPATYGIDYYGDSLFTSEKYYKENNNLVKKIRKAVLKGWDYALKNKGETIELIHNKYNKSKTLEHLWFEADKIEKLILPNIIELGHMNPGRWKFMADNFVELGIINKNFSLDNFIFDEEKEHLVYKKLLYFLSILMCIVFLTFSFLLYMYKKLKRSFDIQNKRLIESEEYFRRLFESSSELFFVIDSKTSEIIDINNNVVDVYGYDSKDEIIGQVAEFLSAGVYPYNSKGIAEVLGNIEPDVDFFSIDWQAKKKNGELFWVELYTKRIKDDKSGNFLIVGRDLTERRKTQEIMMQTEKMMSVGGLAAGMAHEINNPLSGIMSAIQNIERRLDINFEKNKETAEEIDVDLKKVIKYLDKRKILSFIEGIKNSGFRAANIVKNMLEFSRKSNLTKKDHYLEEIIEDSIHLMEKDYNIQSNFDFKYINIKREYLNKNIFIYCNKQEIEQVFVNILKNASYALFDSDVIEKKINITVKLEKEFVVISIKDNGPGMSDSVKKRIFEPFFTTKDTKKGTGLGLSVSYFIITDNHKGFIDVISSPGKGCEFRIKLPVRE